MEESVQEGQYVIIKRHDFTKLIKVTGENSSFQLGKDVVELKEILGRKYFETFRMKFKHKKGKQTFYTLEACDRDKITDWKSFLQCMESGTDNRNIRDDGQSQILSNEEIEEMRNKVSDSKEMIETLVANSKSFNEKTEFSQEKYLRKKDKKYHDFLQVRKPTIRMISEIFYRQGSEKTQGLRIDSLSQLISYSGINSTGNYLVYDSGTGGLIPAAFLNSIGSSASAKVIHLHPGNSPQMQAVYALNLSPEQQKKCVSVNMYSVLRHFYQGYDIQSILSRKRKAIDDYNEKNSAKRQHLDEIEVNKDEIEVDDEADEEPKAQQPTENVPKIPKWYHENEEAVAVLREKVDSLVIVAKEDPFVIFKELLEFVHPGRPFVIFHQYKEVLMECYSSIKALDKTLNLRLISNWMRNYQVLPMRTHPEVQINGSSGYLLHGFTKQ